MIKDEALRLAWDALQQIAHVSAMDYEYQQWAVEAITAIKEALAQPEPNYKKALEVWLDKTEWVQETVKPHELGMHRADVLKQRIEEALAQPEQPKVRTGNCLRVGVCASEGHKIQPHRTWVGLTDEEVKKIVGLDRYTDLLKEVVQYVEAKLRSKNNG
jgi:hypothetical protein